MPANWMRYTARSLSSLWACWWVFFETAEAIGSHQFGQAIIFAVVMLGPAAIAWKWEIAAGILLVLESIGATVLFSAMWMRRFHLAGYLALFAMMCAPPLISGILFLIAGTRGPRTAVSAAHP